MHNGLPWREVLAQRLGRGNPVCQTCGDEPENTLHWMVGAASLEVAGSFCNYLSKQMGFKERQER